MEHCTCAAAIRLELAPCARHINNTFARSLDRLSFFVYPLRCVANHAVSIAHLRATRFPYKSYVPLPVLRLPVHCFLTPPSSARKGLQEMAEILDTVRCDPDLSRHFSDLIPMS